jgi:hypothetical protein
MGRAATPAAGASDGFDDPASDARSPVRAYVPVPRSREKQRERARDPQTPVGELRRLARSHHWDVRVIVAGRPEVPASTLETLAKGGPWAVQAAIARRLDLTRRLQQQLGSAINLVRLPLAANPTLDPALVARLLGDHDGYVAGVAAANPGAPPGALERLAEGVDRPAWILRNIARNPACPAALQDELLTWLAIGGAEGQDLYFDPITCTGTPAAGGIAPFQWNVNQACRMTRPENSALWRVRAAVRQAQSRLSHDRIRVLSVDEKPEVRLVAALYQYTKTLERLEHDEDARVRARAQATRKSLRDRPVHEKVGSRVNRLGNWRFVPLAFFLFLGVFRACVAGDPSPRTQNPAALPDVGQLLDPTSVTTETIPSDPPHTFAPSTYGALTFMGPVSTATMLDGSTIVTGFTRQLGTGPESALLLQVRNNGREPLTVTRIASLIDAKEDWDMTFPEVTVAPGDTRDILYTGDRQPTSVRLIVHNTDGSSVQNAFVPETASPSSEGSIP